MSKTEESKNDFIKKTKAEAEEAPACENNKPAKINAFAHQWDKELAYAQKGVTAETQAERPTWWPDNFQELSLAQRAALWRQQAQQSRRSA